MPDEGKDYRLKNISCHRDNLVGEVKEITREEARELLIKNVDHTLNILFDSTERKCVERELNVHQPIETKDEDEL